MRKNRFIGQDRCYHLVSRLAHRAFFLDDEEKDRAVALMRRVEEFSGVVVLAYAFMSNHFHIFVYVPKAEEIDEAEKGDCHAGRGAAGGGRHQEPRPFLALLHDAAGGEGACRKNRSRQTDVAKAGVQAGMRCCINKTVSISPFELPTNRL